MGSDTLKPGWTRVAFGDVVRLSATRAPDPEAAGFARYVGLEHLDPGDLTIRRWGDVAAGTTFTSVFRPGHVLFGKRRAYQRKVAVPDFGGVCSGDIYVFESTNEHHLLPDLLPFICQTDGFFEHAIGTSAGSLSPRTNWKSLASYEFALPPLDEQRRMVAVLSAAEQCLQSYRLLVNAVTSLESSAVSGVDARTSCVMLGEVIIESNYGSSTRSNRERKGTPLLGIPNILRGELDLRDLNWAYLSKKDTDKYRLHEGDVLVVRTNGNPDYVGRCLTVPALEQATGFASYLIRLTPDISLVRPGYLAAMLNSPSVRHVLRRHVRSSASNYNVNIGGLRATPIPLPPLDTQDSVLSQLTALRASVTECSSRIASIRELQRQVLSESEA